MFQAQQNNNNNNNRNPGYSTVNVNSPTAFGGAKEPLSKRVEKVAVQIFPSYKLKSFTAITFLVTFAFFIIQHITYYTTNLNWLCGNHFWGSHYGPDIGKEYQLHRLISPVLLHQNNQHFFFNMLGMCFFGFELERYFGTLKFALLYIVSGIGGNLLSSVFHYEAFALGASTSLFGLMALQVMYVYEMYQTRTIQGDRLKRIVFQIVFILGANLIFSITEEEVDGAGHLGGFIFGGLMSIIYCNVDQIKKRKYIMVIAILILVISSIVSMYFIIHKEDKYEYSVPLFSEMKNSEDNKGRKLFCSKENESKWKEIQQKEKQKDDPF